MKIDTVKKTFTLKHAAENRNLSLDNYDFAYVAHNTNKDVISFYLCKFNETFRNVLNLDVIINDYDALPALVKRLRMRGILVNIKMIDI